MATTQHKAAVGRKRFTADEYHRMVEVGILREDDRVELIEGEIIQMSPVGSRHVECVTGFTWHLARRLSDDLRLSVQSPIRLGEHGEPELDLVIHRAGDYSRELPGPSDILLVIEVSDTSLAYDREVKLPLYARAGIQEVWLMDLAGERIERHTEPGQDGYGKVVEVRRGEVLESTVLPTLTIKVDDVLR